MKKQPLVGLILVILSIPLLVIDRGSLDVSLIAFSLSILGILLMVSPDVRKVRPQLPQRPGSSTPDGLQGQMTGGSDICADCGKAVPQGVAYCSECAAKRG